MNQVLQILNYISNDINWVIKFHLKEYFLIAVVAIIINLVLLFIVRTKLLYILPAAFFLISFALIIMTVAGSSQLDWEFMLVLIFVNFGAGYILYVLINIFLLRSQE